MNIICLFFPGFISLMIDWQINHNEQNIFLIIKYFVYNFFVNFIGNALVWFISTEKNFFYTEETFTYDFCLKYMAVSLVVAIVLPYIFKFFNNNIKINLEVRKGKNNVKKNNK